MWNLNTPHHKSIYFRHDADARQVVDATVCGSPSWRKISARYVLHVSQTTQGSHSCILTWHRRCFAGVGHVGADGECGSAEFLQRIIGLKIGLIASYIFKIL